MIVRKLLYSVITSPYWIFENICKSLRSNANLFIQIAQHQESRTHKKLLKSPLREYRGASFSLLKAKKPKRNVDGKIVKKELYST